MAAEVINLRQRRKAAERLADQRQAAANAERFGRTKAQKAREEADEARSRRALDGARRDDKAEP